MMQYFQVSAADASKNAANYKKKRIMQSLKEQVCDDSFLL